MIRFWLRAMIALGITCALAVGAIVAQPRDDADILAFFNAPAGCAEPCFFGIRPGVTTHDDVLAILQAHPWVTDLLDNGVAVFWMWNGSQPGFVSHLGSSFYAGRIDVRGGIIQSISLPTAVQFGDFLALFGSPSRAFSTNNYGPRSISITQTVGYFNAGFEIEFTFRCPLRAREDLWSKMVIVTYPNQSPAQYDRWNYVRWSC